MQARVLQVSIFDSELVRLSIDGIVVINIHQVSAKMVSSGEPSRWRWDIWTVILAWRSAINVGGDQGIVRRLLARLGHSHC